MNILITGASGLLVKFLLSNESKFVNGNNHIIDDGWSL